MKAQFKVPNKHIVSLSLSRTNTYDKKAPII